MTKKEINKLVAENENLKRQVEALIQILVNKNPHQWHRPYFPEVTEAPFWVTPYPIITNGQNTTG